MHSSQLTQIHLGPRPQYYKTVSRENIDTEGYLQEEAELQDTLLRLCPEDLWPNGTYAAGCPRPILVGQHHQLQLENLHEALTVAIADIVQRWWSDKDAQFPKRMPLEKEEEDILKWVHHQVLQGNLPDFSECLGSWRPDFLVEEYQGRGENYSITEINARFSFNGFMHEAYGQQAVNTAVEGETSGLIGATDSNKIVDGLFGLFDGNYPLHILKGAEKGIDVHMFLDAVKTRTGIKARIITPADLRLLADPRSKGGYRLCCLASEGRGVSTFTASSGEDWEEVHQIGLELHQRELVALGSEMWRQVALRCFNDMRTILLVHDKRMLGIVRQEIPNLLLRGVLTVEQASSLNYGVVDTILPGSSELHRLIETCKTSPEARCGYIVKPIRSGKGDGIVFGDDVSAEDWMSTLEALVSPKVIQGVTCVVQRKIIPRLYDMVLKARDGIVTYPLVGTYHVVNGELLGLGTWRASGGRIVAVSSGGSWICSVIGRSE